MKEFRSRPTNAFVDIFALSQSECVVAYTTSGKNKHLNRKTGSGFLFFDWI
jgi:hypothetical protein